MNARVAKKILCCPCDPYQKPAKTTPYHDGQFIAAGRVYRRALRRGDPAGALKWSSRRPRVHRGRWRPGFNGEAFYGPSPLV